MAMEKFGKETHAFNYVYEKALSANETVILEMPKVSPNKKCISEIGWQADGSVALYGTLSSNPESVGTLWQQILEYDDVNKTVTALKIVNSSTACNVIVRVIFQ